MQHKTRDFRFLSFNFTTKNGVFVNSGTAFCENKKICSYKAAKNEKFSV